MTTNKTKKQHKLNIFDELTDISCKNKQFYSNLPEDLKKSVQPLVLMRWLTGTRDIRQVFFLNELANPLIFPLSKHKQLLIHILSICCSGKSQRYAWNKMERGSKNNKFPISIDVIKQYYQYSTKQAIQVLPLLSNDDILFYSEQLAIDSDKQKLLNKELKTRFQ